MRLQTTLPALLLGILLILPLQLNAQTEPERLTFSTESTVSVDGTSNRDDWTVTAEEFDGWVAIQEAEGTSVPAITEARLVVQAQQMTGGRSTVMDRLMQNALKANAHPEIEFSLTEIETEPSEENPDRYLITATGELTLAGVTRIIDVTLEGSQREDGSWQFDGSHALLMSDYEIERPTALFGALVTGDEVVAQLSLHAVQE
ncbi:MAG: YceI family protein [Balneolaceae bacterium]